jgi:threonine/homoserine/homoserine lactone efflux protein
VTTIVALLGLAAVHWLAVMSPGPSTVLVVQTAAVSRRGGLIAAFAMMLGALLWAAAALYGLQALFAEFAWLYRVFQVAGGLFLIYLAVQIWRHARDPLPEIAPAAVRASDAEVFARALLLQLSNPKIMVFFGSIFLSVLPHDMPAWMQAVVLALVAFDEFTWFAVLALTFSGATARAFYRRTKFWLDRFMGGALGLLGLRLVLVSR